MIRPALLNEVELLVELGRQMHAESWFAHMPFDPGVLRRTLHFAMTQGFCYVTIGTDSRIDGGMIGLLVPSWFGSGSMAVDLAVFVTADRRGGMKAYRLVERFIEWAAEKGALEASLGISTNVAPERLGALYENMGFTRVGGIYKMRMKQCAPASS